MAKIVLIPGLLGFWVQTLITRNRCEIIFKSYTGGCIKSDSIKWDKTNQRKPKTYAKTLESALTAVSINFSAQKIHKNCCLNVPCILHLKRKIFFGYFSSFVDVRIKFFCPILYTLQCKWTFWIFNPFDRPRANSSRRIDGKDTWVGKNLHRAIWAAIPL